MFFKFIFKISNQNENCPLKDTLENVLQKIIFLKIHTKIGFKFLPVL